MGDLSGYLLGVLIGAGILAFAGYTIYSHHVIVATSVAVDATVVTSETVTGDTTPHTSGGRGTYPHVEYRYSHDGETHTSTNICPGAGTGCYGPQTADNAEAVVERYPEGDTITAYVDPDDPAEAHLDHGSVPPVYYLAGAMGLFAFVASVLNVVSVALGVAIPGIPGGDG